MSSSSKKEELEKDKDVQDGYIQAIPLKEIFKPMYVMRKDTMIRKWNADVYQSYIVLKKLGEGSFGEVFLVQHKQLKVLRALKIIAKFSKPHANAVDQLQLLKKLDHPNILNIYEYFQTLDKWYIITEYFQGKQLFDEILDKNHLSQPLSAQIIKQVLKALNYIHINKIIHRDIKAENILIRQQNQAYVVKVIDWGLGAIVDTDTLNRKCGTPQYCAPEVLNGSYHMECDLWSLGVLVYIMLSGYMPFKGKDVRETIQKVKRGYVDFGLQVWKEISFLAKDFIVRLIQKNPKKRLTASEALEHPWIVNYSNISLKQNVTESNLEETLKRIKDFHTQTKFQVVTLNYILNFIQTPKQLQKLKREFEALDLNHDGELSYEELLFAYRKIYGVQADLIVEKIFKNIDLDNSGKISFSEFITFATQITNDFSQEQLKQAFKLFDADNDGLIDQKQISELIQYEKNSRATTKEFDDIISEIDLNHDGKIDFQEFIQHINKAVQRAKTKTGSTLKFSTSKKNTQKKDPLLQSIHKSSERSKQKLKEQLDKKQQKP